jgi:integrase
MTELRRRMMEDLQLAGYAASTQESYLDAVRGLAKYYMRSPDLLSEDDVRGFFLHLLKERKAARSTFVIYLSGIKFFFEKTLQRSWSVFGITKPAKSKRLPVVLSREEVRTLLKSIKNPRVKMALTIIYACGLRLTNNRILSLDNGTVTFRYQNSDNREWKNMRLPANEFLRRYLQHVLPQGFHKVRYYGLLSPANRVTLKRLQLLLTDRRMEKEKKKEETPDPPKAERRCPCCGEGRMVTISQLPRKPRSPT